MLDPLEWPVCRAALSFDHNATTPIASEVRAAVSEVLLSSFGNASSLHTEGRSARGLIERSRCSVAALLGCQPGQVVFTTGGTEANNTVIKGVFGARGGGHVVTTSIEHESVLGACRQIESLGGSVTRINAGRDGRIRAEDVIGALRDDTVLISVMHANNETGAIQPISEIARIAASAGIPLHTDAVQSFGKLPFSVGDLGCEFLSLSAHKINGPKGAGAFFWRGKTPFHPLVYGGDQERGLRAGTEGTHQLVGLGVACDLAGKRRESELRRMSKLRRLMILGLKRLFPSVVIHEAPGDFQLPGTINAAFPGKSGLRILAGLDCYRLGVSIGSACTADRFEPSHVLIGMGVSHDEALSSIRISMGTTTRALSVLYFLWSLSRVLIEDPPGFAYLDPQHLTPDLISSADTQVIDLRFPHERLIAPSVPGAMEWSVLGFEWRLSEVPKNKLVVLMCATGVISTGAGYRLARAGHSRVRVVFGGYSAWRSLWPGSTSSPQVFSTNPTGGRA